MELLKAFFLRNRKSHLGQKLKELEPQKKKKNWNSIYLEFQIHRFPGVLNLANHPLFCKPKAYKQNPESGSTVSARAQLPVLHETKRMQLENYGNRPAHKRKFKYF